MSKDLQNSGLSMCTPSYQSVLRPSGGGGDGGEGDGNGFGNVDSNDSVLNEEWELVPNKIGKFRRRTPNPHEEVLFAVETDQCDLDVLLMRLESTLRRLEEYLDLLERPNNGEELPPVVEFLSAVHKATIRQLYSGDAQRLFDEAREDPVAAVTVMRRRVELKFFVGRLAKLEFNRRWSELYRRHFNLSLDLLAQDAP